MRWILELALGAGWLVAASDGAAAQDPVPVVAPTDPAAKPEGEAPPDEGTKPGGLLGIAEREAARSAKVLRDRILASLRNWTLKHELEADRGRDILLSVVNCGPDAVPVLLSFVRAAAAAKGETAIVQPAARALAGLFDRTKNNPQILHDLTEAVKDAPAPIRVDVLIALEGIDHKIVYDFACPQLGDESVSVRGAAVRALGKQKSHAPEVAKLLRAHLQTDKGVWIEALRALYGLGDKSSVDLAQSVLATSQDAHLVAVALRTVAEFGGKAALSPLEPLLDANRPSSFDDTLLKVVVDAVAKIGLREIDAKRRAEEILANCMKLHTNVNVREHALWALGPYQNADALKKLEEPILKDVDANRRSNPARSNLNNYVQLAESRLQFESWTKAIDALKKAREEDDKQFRATYIEELTSVALCGLDKFDQSRKILEKLSPEERVKLLGLYPVLEKMAKDPKYRDLFIEK
jgi:HEAT repeat protein